MILSVIGWIIGGIGLIIGGLGIFDVIDDSDTCIIVMWSCIALMWIFCIIDFFV